MKLLDGRSEAFQWDSNIYAVLKNIDEGEEVHFAHRKDVNSLRGVVEIKDGNLVAKIPNILLQRAGFIQIYWFLQDKMGNRTIKREELKVLAKEKPEDYEYEGDEFLSYKTLDEKITKTNKRIDSTNEKIVETKLEILGELGYNKTVKDSYELAESKPSKAEVKTEINSAINDFATKISDDGTVNTFKEMVDYASAHQGEYTTLFGEVQKNSEKINALNEGQNNLKKLSHTHSNKELLDLITVESVENTKDWAENDSTSKAYIKNRPGGYVQETLVDIEWDGNTEGKYVVDVMPEFFQMCKVSDTPVTLEKLKGSIFTGWGLIDGNEVYESVTGFPEDAIQQYDGGFVISFDTPSGQLTLILMVVNQAPLIIEGGEDGNIVFNEVGVYFSELKGFDSAGSKIQLRSVKNELIKKMPSKYLDLDNINTSIQEISETLEPLPKKVDSLQIDSSAIRKRLTTVENQANYASDRFFELDKCLSTNYYMSQQQRNAIIYCVTSVEDTTEIVDIMLPEESKTISIYFEPKTEFDAIKKFQIYFPGSTYSVFSARHYNAKTSKWVDLHRTAANGYRSCAYVDDDGQLAFLYVAPDDVGKTVAMTKEYAWKTIKLPDKSGYYSKEYVVIEYVSGGYVDRIDVWGDWTSKSEPSISGKGVKQLTFSTLERIEQLTDEYINNLIDTKLGVIENGSY